jgi:hypothetical protein
MSLQKYTVQEAQNAGLGQAGYKIITTNTGTIDPSVTYIAVTILSGGATNITVALEGDKGDPKFPDVSATAIDAGVTIFGRWDKVTLGGTTPVAICYKG